MLKVGIVGSGFGLYGLLPAFNSIEGCEVVSICGKQSDRLVAYCDSIGLTARYTDYKEMIRMEQLDAIAVAVTPNAQYDIAKLAIAKGIHVFAEKPLAANTEQATELFQMAQENNIVTAVDFIFPEIEEWKFAKKIVDEKTYGSLQHISVHWDFLSYDIKNAVSSWKTMLDEGGGALSFYFSHALYYIEHFAGKVTSVTGTLTYDDHTPNDGDVGADISFTCENGASGDAHIDANNADTARHQVVLTCESAKLILTNTTDVTEHFSLQVVKDDETTPLIVTKEEGPLPDEDERVRIVKKLATRFVQACQTHTSVTPSFKDGVRVHHLIDMIRNSST